MRSSVDFWYRRISRSATVPGLYRCGFLTPPAAAGADLRAALAASCFLGALPPVDFLAVCFFNRKVSHRSSYRYVRLTLVRAIVSEKDGMRERAVEREIGNLYCFRIGCFSVVACLDLVFYAAPVTASPSLWKERRRRTRPQHGANFIWLPRRGCGQGVSLARLAIRLRRGRDEKKTSAL